MTPAAFYTEETNGQHSHNGHPEVFTGIFPTAICIHIHQPLESLLASSPTCQSHDLEWQPTQVSGAVWVQDDSLDPHSCPPPTYAHSGLTPPDVHLHASGLTPTPASIVVHPWWDPAVTVEYTVSQGPHSYFCIHSRPQPLLLVLDSTTMFVSATGPCYYTGTCSWSPLLSVWTPPALITTAVCTGP